MQVILDCLVEGVGKEETERAVGTAFFGEERSKMLDVVSHCGYEQLVVKSLFTACFVIGKAK